MRSKGSAEEYRLLSLEGTTEEEPYIIRPPTSTRKAPYADASHHAHPGSRCSICDRERAHPQDRGLHYHWSLPTHSRGYERAARRPHRLLGDLHSPGLEFFYSEDEGTKEGG